MSRSIRIPSAVAGLVAALALVPAAAGAAQPSAQFHDRFTESFSDSLCGIETDARATATNNFFVYADGSVKGTGSSRVTVTNPLNGKTVVLSSAGQFSDAAPVIDEQAGTITFHPTFKGLPAKIQTAGGSVLLRDAGIIAFEDTFDLDTGELVASDITVNKGPHPEADSDFTRSCEVITAALS
jgi:hypothetical protein